MGMTHCVLLLAVALRADAFVSTQRHPAFGSTRQFSSTAPPEPPKPREEAVITADDPLVLRVAAEVAEVTGGASLDSLLNPAKLLNVERELVELRARREALNGTRNARNQCFIWIRCTHRR